MSPTKRIILSILSKITLNLRLLLYNLFFHKCCFHSNYSNKFDSLIYFLTFSTIKQFNFTYTLIILKNYSFIYIKYNRGKIISFTQFKINIVPNCSIQAFRNPFGIVVHTVLTKVHMPLNKPIITI